MSHWLPSGPQPADVKLKRARMTKTISAHAIVAHERFKLEHGVGDMFSPEEEANMSTATALFPLPHASESDRLGDEIARLSAAGDGASAPLLTTLRGSDTT